mmetsp:Transcript_5168/g.12336  ORF Transcript_5168/g.12336 Transcript_5168/m.12336 type:complete len:326 (+) Transcript_5168:297-1274(+)
MISWSRTLFGSSILAHVFDKIHGLSQESNLVLLNGLLPGSLGANRFLVGKSIHVIVSVGTRVDLQVSVGANRTVAVEKDRLGVGLATFGRNQNRVALDARNLRKHCIVKPLVGLVRPWPTGRNEDVGGKDSSIVEFDSRHKSSVVSLLRFGFYNLSSDKLHACNALLLHNKIPHLLAEFSRMNLCNRFFVSHWINSRSSQFLFVPQNDIRIDPFQVRQLFGGRLVGNPFAGRSLLLLLFFFFFALINGHGGTGEPPVIYAGQCLCQLLVQGKPGLLEFLEGRPVSPITCQKSTGLAAGTRTDASGGIDQRDRNLFTAELLQVILD